MISKADAQSRLRGREHDIVEALEWALKKLGSLSTNDSDFAGACGGSSKALCTILNHFARYRLMAVWGDEVACVGNEDDAWLHIDGIMLKLKKLAKDGSIQGIRTKRSQQVYNQGEMECMPPKTPRLIVGYTTDEWLTCIKSIEICLPNERHQKDWSYELSVGVNVGQQTNMFDISSKATPSTTPIKRPPLRFKPVTGVEDDVTDK